MAQLSDRSYEQVRVSILEFLDTDVFNVSVENCAAIEPGLEQFLKDASLSGDTTEEEIAFLKDLKLKGKRPSRIYYYRELQNRRDPLHFPSVARNPENQIDRSGAAGTAKECFHEKQF